MSSLNTNLRHPKALHAHFPVFFHRPHLSSCQTCQPSLQRCQDPCREPSETELEIPSKSAHLHKTLGLIFSTHQGLYLLNSENLKEAIAQLCNELQVCNFTML